ncbi:hypothetical protein OnM2_069048 [Erysiphe neolycopersici]|uniref:Uncharacterized protein n=1 Tax=Erysiphe neolycopersici TaxID=212602 RepID=A0A420HLC5_9PEZI|nr:hypothetical protein OnM2_069048 [Erysiphe neolycopersici]
MRVFDISSLSIVILFPLLWAGKTVAIIEDAYGESNYGIKCSETASFEQHDIYAAAKHLCDAKIKNPELTYKSIVTRNQQDYLQKLYKEIGEDKHEVPLSIIPIFTDGLLYPIKIKPCPAKFSLD